MVFNKCKKFEYEEETMLDLGEISDEWESEENEHSLEYMREVVAYDDAIDSSVK